MSAKSKNYPNHRLVCMSTSMVKAIADYRFDRRVPSEVEAIRRLIEAGLKAEADKKATAS